MLGTMGIYPVCIIRGVALVWLVVVRHSLMEAACAGHKPEQVGPMEVKWMAGGISWVDQAAWD